ncbi:MAG: hypothetical protein GX075_05905 [Firmicutes bacterium]|nr:hypothetical protein [Bacillota bacterium]
MPISGIGKINPRSQFGYTLFEVLAVLILIAAVGLLVFPGFQGGEEKVYLNQIAGLMQADFQMARDEAICGKTEIVAAFTENGYRFEIGEIEIQRVFDRFDFRWDLPAEAELPDPSAPNETVSDVEQSEADDGYDNYGENEDNENGAEGGDALVLEAEKAVFFELTFKSDGSYPETSLTCATRRYTGKFELKEDGSVIWNYAKK